MPSKLNVLTVVATVLGSVYLVNGIVTLAGSSTGGDLGLRRIESSMLASGVNPYDLSGNFAESTRSPQERARLAKHGLEDVPSGAVSGYPPWGLAISMILVPPFSLKVATFWYLMTSLAALGIVLLYGYRLGSRISRDHGLFFAGTVFAVAANASTLRLGQYGIILNAALVLGFVGLARGRWAGPGLALALAGIKPSYSLLFLYSLVFKWRVAAVAVIAALLVLASLISWALTGVDPIEMTGQMTRQARYVTFGDTGPLSILNLVLANEISIRVLFVVGVVLSSILMYWRRHSHWIVLASIAAVIGKLYTYHRQYDNVMLIFPLLALAYLASATASIWYRAMFAAFACSLWAPLPLSAFTPPVVTMLSVVWLLGLATILHSADGFEPLTDETIGR